MTAKRSFVPVYCLIPGRGGLAGTPGGFDGAELAAGGRCGAAALREEAALPVRAPADAGAARAALAAGRAGAGFAGAVLTGDGAKGLVLATTSVVANGFFFLLVVGKNLGNLGNLGKNPVKYVR